MKKILLFLFLLISAASLAQPRLTGTTGGWTTVDANTYTATFTRQTDLTGNSFTCNDIETGFRVVSGTASNGIETALKMYTVTAIANSTSSTIDLTVDEVGATQGAPSGLVFIYDPDGRMTIPQVPVGSTGATAALQAAIDTYNSRYTYSVTFTNGAPSGAPASNTPEIVQDTSGSNILYRWDGDSWEIIGLEIALGSGAPGGSPATGQRFYIDYTNNFIYWNDNGSWSVMQAVNVPVGDLGGYFAGTEVEAVTQALGLDVSNLQTLSGRPDGSTHNGTFTGSTIPDNETTKQNLQSLETAVETKVSSVKIAPTGMYRGLIAIDSDSLGLDINGMAAPPNIAAGDKFPMHDASSGGNTSVLWSTIVDQMQDSTKILSASYNTFSGLLTLNKADGGTVTVTSKQIDVRASAPTGTPSYPMAVDTVGTDTVYFANNGAWVRFSAGGGSATPGGSNTNFQYNNFGVLGGDAEYSKGAGNTTTGTLQIDYANADSTATVSKYFLKVEPLTPPNAGKTGNAAFYESISNTPQSGHMPNQVKMEGFNLATSGGKVTSNLPVLGESWEYNYRPGAGRWVEKHEIYVPTNGTNQQRLSSYTIQENASGTFSTSTLFHTVQGFDLRDTAGNMYLVASKEGNFASKAYTSGAALWDFSNIADSKNYRFQVTSAGDLTSTLNAGSIFDYRNNVSVTASGSATSVLTVVGGTLNGSSFNQNFLTIGGAFPSSLSSAVSGINATFTTAGSSSQQIVGNYTNLGAGYTGTSPTSALLGDNAVAGTGTNLSLGNTSTAPSGNNGFTGYSRGTTTGNNIGGFAEASAGNLNIGFLGKTTTAKNSATNIGVAGFALNTGTSPVQIGGYFGLQNATPTFASAALIADNGSTTSPIFLARDNGTTVATIADGGRFFSGTLTDFIMTASDSARLEGAGGKLDITSGFSRLYAGGTIAYQVNNSNLTHSAVIADNQSTAYQVTISGGNTAIAVKSTDNDELVTIGATGMHTRTAGRLSMSKGANVASANDLTLGEDGNVFHITGNTTVNAITTSEWLAGSEIILIFDGTPTVKNNTSGGAGTAVMLLAGGVDFSATANDVLKLVFDGTSWFEISRSVN